MSVRDITLEDTFHVLFSTRAFATGAPTTLDGTPVVSAYENDSLTQITAGITLGVDHDSVTGLNLLTIVATAANGYESGKDYSLVITTGTVDSVSVVGEVVGEFTIGRSAAAVDLANGTDGLGAIKSDTAAILLDTAEIGAAGAGLTDLGGMSTTMKGQVNAEVDTAFTTQMADSTATDGTRPTREQAILMITRFLMERAVVGTTLTVTKEDGTTAVMTFTLDSVTPTSITRAS